MSERESRNNFMASCSIPAVWRIYHHGYIQKHIIISYHTDVSSAPNVKMPCFFYQFFVVEKTTFFEQILLFRNYMKQQYDFNCIPNDENAEFLRNIFHPFKYFAQMCQKEF